jgi:hypothetical protein
VYVYRNDIIITLKSTCGLVALFSFMLGLMPFSKVLSMIKILRAW